MKIKQLKTIKEKYTNILVPFFEGQVDKKYIAKVTGSSHLPKFEAKSNESLLLLHPKNGKQFFLLGLGKKEKRNAAFTCFRNFAVKQKKYFSGNLAVDLQQIDKDLTYHAALGLTQATYNLGYYKSDKNLIHPFLTKAFDLAIVCAENVGSMINEGCITGECQNRIMKLVDLPANIKTPQYLAKHAKASGKKYAYKVEVLTKKQLEKEKLSALLAVGQGSNHPPVLIKMEYKPARSKSKQPLLALVGKGITFDTGGISLKSSTNMHYMKSDMGGAAAVMGAMELAARLKLNIHIVGIVPTAENSIDANSIRPGDVIGSYSGKSIEIIDTDAEGRLVLADGLAFANKKYKPKTMINLATLTGSCVLTLGYAACGLFTNNDGLANTIQQAGEEMQEKAWRLPLWDDYKEFIKSDIADVKNLSGRPIAGAIAAAKFLEVFTNEHPRWAHLDIAGVSFGATPFTSTKSATGFGVRLLINVMKQLSIECLDKTKL